MDGGEAIFLNNTLGQADGVFEVVAVPRHERDAHVLTQSQFTHISGRTICHARRRADWLTQIRTSGIWLMQVFWLERVYLVRL
jgi:hypothetical protein